jgi:hypothetical protein
VAWGFAPSFIRVQAGQPVSTAAASPQLADDAADTPADDEPATLRLSLPTGMSATALAAEAGTTTPVDDEADPGLVSFSVWQGRSDPRTKGAVEYWSRVKGGSVHQVEGDGPFGVVRFATGDL